MESQNTTVVQEAYAAFGRGDIDALLGYVADGVVWRSVIGAKPHVPFGGERRGAAAVREFFRIVAEQEEFTQFEPREYVAQGDRVVALGHYRARVKATGKWFESDFAMVFTVNNGRITRFEEYTDVASINDAYAAAATV